MKRTRGTGTIERRIIGGKCVYCARMPDAERKLLGKFDTLREAAAALDHVMKLAASGRVSVARKLADYGLTVFDAREKEGYRSVRDSRSAWRQHVMDWPPAQLDLSEVRRKHVLEWVRGLRAKGLARQSIVNALNTLRAVFRAAVDAELAESNPCDGVAVKREARTEETSTWLSLDELARVFWSVDLPAKHLIAFASATGLRQGEMIALLAADVHLTGPAPHVVVRYGSPGKPTKSGRIRKVPLLPLALAAAQSWAQLRTPAEHGSPQYFFSSVRGGPRDKGHPVGRHALWAGWMAAAGIARTVRWHDLRHTCATLLLTGAFGPPWSMEAVKEMLGHSSITVTERYAKATGSLAEAAAALTHQRPTQPTSATFSQPAALRNSADLQGFQSHLRESNSRPTVYEASGKPSAINQLGADGGLAVALLRRAAVTGDVPRAAVEWAAALLDAAERGDVRRPA